MGGRYVVDIETNGLLQTVTRCWIVFAVCIETLKTKYWLEGDLGWMKFIDEAECVIGHNIIGYDFAVLEKLFNYKVPKHVKIRDTLIFSSVLNYRRFPGDRHSLADWGNFLGFPKGEHSDWTQYSPEMLVYCERDCMLNVKVYNYLMVEFNNIADVKPKIVTYMKAEHYVAKWSAQCSLQGWPFNLPRAKELFIEMEKELNATREALLPLGLKTVAKDKAKGVVEPKQAKWVKSGAYNAHTASWFGIDPNTGQDVDRLVEGAYSRVEFVELDIDSTDDVKIFLFRNGWQPTEWNFKYDESLKKSVKTSPKITEDSLECMNGNGAKYCEFLSTKSRFGIIKNWIANCDENGMLHGDCFTVGTPSMRARHSIIVNVPAADSSWGKEMRELFTNIPGWTLIGCDSEGNQARGLAHYLKSQEYIDLLLNGDIHQYNADRLTEVLANLGITYTVPRSAAKRALYATLFGASGAKLLGYVLGYQEVKLGNKLKDGFLKAIPGFKKLMEKLENIYGGTSKTGKGFIPGMGGNNIYCDSYHKLLVYLLQACEKATCAAALMLTMDRLEAANIPYRPCIFMHDEIDYLVPDAFAEEAAEIGRKAFEDGPKLFNIEIMNGSKKIGSNWYEVH